MDYFEGIVAITLVILPIAGTYIINRQGRKNAEALTKKVETNTDLTVKTHDAVNSRMDQLISNMNIAFAAKVAAIEKAFALKLSELEKVIIREETETARQAKPTRKRPRG